MGFQYLAASLIQHVLDLSEPIGWKSSNAKNIDGPNAMPIRSEVSDIVMGCMC